MRLDDGNFVFFHNSWGGKGIPAPGYQPAWVVLDKDDPTKILARVWEGVGIFFCMSLKSGVKL